jgi:hypothetical protein
MAKRSPRLLVVASTFPSRRGEGTPGFVWDLAEQEAGRFETIVLVPRVGDAPARERAGSLEIRRFRYFPRRWEDLADGAILENLRARPLRWLQVLPFLAAEAFALRRLIAEFDPDVLHVHWVLPQGLVAALAAPRRRSVLTAHGGMCTPWRGGSPAHSNGSRCAERPPSRCRTRRCVRASSSSAPILTPRWSCPWAPT